MTWEAVQALPPSETVALLPVGATEAHGPHLPLNTDVIISAATAEEGRRTIDTLGEILQEAVREVLR